MKRLLTIAICILCLASLTTAALAERSVVVTPITQEVQPLSVAPNGAAADCAMGNLNPPAYAITDWIWGAESYSYVFYADQSQCACSSGFTVEQVHMYMQFGAEDVPVSFNAYVGFEEAVYDEATGCWMPGTPFCASPEYTVTIDAAGLYDIALPIPAGTCDCAYFGYWYSISVNFTTAFDSSPDLITDNMPVGCTSWNDYGLGWLDLQDFGMPGETAMFADIVCCENPVSSDETTLDGIKALFR